MSSLLTRLPHMTNWQLRDTDLTPEGWAKEQHQKQQAAAFKASYAS